MSKWNANIKNPVKKEAKGVAGLLLKCVWERGHILVEEITDYEVYYKNGKKMYRKITKDLGPKKETSIFNKKKWYKYLKKDAIKVAQWYNNWGCIVSTGREPKKLT